LSYKITAVTLILLFTSTRSLYAQNDIPHSVDSSYSSHTWAYIGVGSAVLITAGMFHYDQQIYDDLYSWKMNNKIVKDASPVITNLGDGKFSV